MIIDKDTQTEVTGTYKSSSDSQRGPDEFKSTAQLEEKSGTSCFTVVGPRSGRIMGTRLSAVTERLTWLDLTRFKG
jgi:hypothetical protein